MINVKCSDCKKDISIYPYRLGVTKRFHCKRCWKRERRNLDLEMIKIKYLGGLSCESIAKELNVSSETIIRRLKKLKIARRNQSQYTKENNSRYFTWIDNKKIKSMYLNEKMSTEKIGKRLGVSSSTILKRLKKEGIEIRDSSLARKLSFTNEQREFLKQRNLKMGYCPPSMEGRKHTKETKEKFKKRWDDPLFKEKMIDITKNNWKNPEFRKHMIKIMSKNSKKRWENKEYREKAIKILFKSMLQRPTSLEKGMIDIIQKYNLPYKYTGDGSFLIGYKNPDFINTNGEKKLIEVGNIYHHQNNYEQKRREHFAKYGWKSYIFINDTLNEKKIVDKLTNNYV